MRRAEGKPLTRWIEIFSSKLGKPKKQVLSLEDKCRCWISEPFFYQNKNLVLDLPCFGERISRCGPIINQKDELKKEVKAVIVNSLRAYNASLEERRQSYESTEVDLNLTAQDDVFFFRDVDLHS